MTESQKKKYKYLIKQVYEARKEVQAKKRLITLKRKELHLDKKTEMLACINVFEKVLYAHTSDDTGFTQDCDSFCSGTYCMDTKCDWFFKQHEYVDAYKRCKEKEDELNTFKQECRTSREI